MTSSTGLRTANTVRSLPRSTVSSSACFLSGTLRLAKTAEACGKMLGLVSPSLGFPHSHHLTSPRRFWTRSGLPKERSASWAPTVSPSPNLGRGARILRDAVLTIASVPATVNNLVSRASGAWSGRHKEAADTFVWFHPISNTRLTSSTSVYVSSLLAGPRPSVKRRELAGNGTQPWEEWPIPEDHEAVEEKRAALHARDLYDDVLSKCKASLRTWSIMAPDMLNTANEAAAWWTGQPKALSNSFAEAWKMDTDEQIGLLQWFISTMESYGRP